MSLIMLIDMDMPSLTGTVNEKLTLASSINFNFSFAQPLSYVSDKSMFGESPERYAQQGIECTSFMYNTQSQVIIYLFLMALSRVAIKLLTKCEKKEGKAWKLVTTGLSALSNVRPVIYEMYFQQRMVFYLYMFHFLQHRVEYHHMANLIPSAITAADFLLACAFVFIDSAFVFQYSNYIRVNVVLCKQRNGCVSLQKEFPFNKKLTMRKVIVLADVLGLQLAIPFLIVSDVRSDVKCGMMAGVCALNVLLLLLKVGFRVNMRQMTCYVCNYLCMFVFCLMWLIGHLKYDDFENSMAFGVAMSVALVLPVVATMICYLPQNIRETKEMILAFKERCKTKQKC